ncbi:ATP-grasp domain-containing protein [Plantactinospora sp. B6F1]|uniref:ATP-grasp domain-containing protein n=1 Tax=Plantactinospora sp. B6F1 TaxID=3158971 RepID=UPI0032D9132A
MSIVVVYDQGAVSPTEIVQAADPGCPLVVVVGPSEHAQRIRPLFLEAAAAVYDLADVDLIPRLRGHDVTGMVTFSEPMLLAASLIAADLGLPFHDAATVRLLTDKAAQRERLRSAGVDSTASRVVSDVAQWDAVVRDLGLPVVVKPVQGVSSRNTVLIGEREAGRAQLDRLLREEGRVVAEEYLRGVEVDPPFGDYVSVETVVHQGERCHLAITGKLRLAPPFRECGQFWPARLDPATREAVLLSADQAVKALDVRTGILHTEFKLTPDGPRIIEVNGRAGGYIPELARRAAGIDLVDIAMRISRGARVELSPADPDRVYFQFTTPAPTESGRVCAVSGRESLDGVPGVTGYHAFVRPGVRVGGYQTHDLDLVVGDVPDHAALASTTEMIMDGISYQFDIGGRQIRRSARDLIDNL